MLWKLKEKRSRFTADILLIAPKVAACGEQNQVQLRKEKFVVPVIWKLLKETWFLSLSWFLHFCHWNQIHFVNGAELKTSLYYLIHEYLCHWLCLHANLVWRNPTTIATFSYYFHLRLCYKIHIWKCELANALKLSKPVPDSCTVNLCKEFKGDATRIPVKDDTCLEF